MSADGIISDVEITVSCERCSQWGHRVAGTHGEFVRGKAMEAAFDHVEKEHGVGIRVNFRFEILTNTTEQA